MTLVFLRPVPGHLRPGAGRSCRRLDDMAEACMPIEVCGRDPDPLAEGPGLLQCRPIGDWVLGSRESDL